MLKSILFRCAIAVIGIGVACYKKIDTGRTWAFTVLKDTADWLLAPFREPKIREVRPSLPMKICDAGARTPEMKNLSKRDRTGLMLGAEQHRMSLCM